MADLATLNATKLHFAEAAAPATPDAGEVVTYAKADGLMYSKDDAGTETLMSSGASSGTSLNPGTSFPGSPATNTLCFRTDRGLLYYYDGTRWLSVTLYTLQIAEVISSISPPGSVAGNAAVWSNDYDIWMVDLRWSSYVQTTNDGSNYWTVTLYKRDAGTATVVVAPTTAADAPSVYVTHKTAIGALLGTGEDIFTMNVGNTGTPGSINLATMLTYRLVG